MDFDELRFAAHVRDLASAIRNSRSGEYYRSLGDDEERHQKRDAWEAQHPASEFVPDALKRIKDVAMLIRQLEADGH